MGGQYGNARQAVVRARVGGFYVLDHSFQLIREDKTGATIYFYVYYTAVTRWERI